MLLSLPIKCHEKLFKLPKNIVLMILLWERDQHSHRPDKNQICCQDFCVCTVICLFLGSSEPSQQIEGCSFHEYPEYGINGNRNTQIVITQIAMKNEFIIFYQGSSLQNMEMTKMGITSTWYV